MTDHSSERRRTPAYPPMSQEGFAAVKEYITQAIAYRNGTRDQPPDEALLRVGVPQGSILNITPSLGIQVRDTANGDLRTPREFDPEAVAIIRLILLAGGSMGLNRKETNKPNRADYPHVRGRIDTKEFKRNGRKRRELKVHLLRVIADTKPGRQTPESGNHYSLRRRDIPGPEMHRSSRKLTRDGKPTKPSYLGRAAAIKLATGLLRKNAHRLSFSIMEIELRNLLREAFKLLDLRPLKTRSR